MDVALRDVMCKVVEKTNVKEILEDRGCETRLFSSMIRNSLLTAFLFHLLEIQDLTTLLKATFEIIIF